MKMQKVESMLSHSAMRFLQMGFLENLWVKSTITYPASTIHYLTTKWGGLSVGD